MSKAKEFSENIRQANDAPIENFEPSENWKIDCFLSSVMQYAEDHSLTANQIQDIWNEGVLKCSATGKIKIPSYTEDSKMKYVDFLKLQEKYENLKKAIKIIYEIRENFYINFHKKTALYGMDKVTSEVINKCCHLLDEDLERLRKQLNEIEI